jgi:DNA polymerase III subunit delta'
VWRIIGQTNLTSLFESSIKSNAISHAYLILGPEHVGKTTMVIDVAMALNCEAKTRPCGECISCKKILKNMHPDIFEISLESIKTSEQKTKKEIGIEEIRRLQQLANLTPYEGKYKVFIINGADLLSNEASNCLLKTLEEPSPNIIIFLLASDETNLLPTIVSRCQKIQLQPLSIKETQNVLVEKFGASIEKGKFAAYLSEGKLGEAITIIRDEKQIEKRYKIISEFLPLLESDINQRFYYVSQLDDDRKNIQELFGIWLSLWRDLMLIKCDSLENITNVNCSSELDKFAAGLSIGQIKEFIESLRNSLLLVMKNVNIRLLLEVLMFDMPFINNRTPNIIKD